MYTFRVIDLIIFLISFSIAYGVVTLINYFIRKLKQKFL
jgi:capsule polysaccharide export protein KpsE/RkpR